MCSSRPGIWIRTQDCSQKIPRIQALHGLEPVDIDGHSFLVLPEGVYLLGDSAYGSTMLLRSCYATLMSLAARKERDRGMRKIVLTGNPGIGKTLGIVEVMRVAASRGVTVVLQLGKEGDDRYLFRAGMPVLAGDENDFREFLEDPNVWYIVDSTNEPRACPAWTLFVVSPTRDLFWRYFKEARRGPTRASSTCRCGRRRRWT